MATLKGAYQRFVTSIIRLWKREESENSDVTQEATNSSSELLTDDSPTKKESNSVSEVAEPYFLAKEEPPSHSLPDLLIENIPIKETSQSLNKKKPSNLKRGLSLLRLTQSRSANDLKQSDEKYIDRRPRNNSSPVLARKLSNTNLLRPPSSLNLYERHPRLRREKTSSSNLFRDSSPVKRGRSTSNLLKDHPPVVLRRNLGTSDLLGPPRVQLRRELSISNLFLGSPRIKSQRKQRPKSVSDILIPDPSQEKLKPQNKSPTTLKLSPRVFKNTLKKTKSDPPLSPEAGSTARNRTLTIASRFSKFASKKIDGTLRKRTKTDAKFKLTIMEEIEIGKGRTMPVEPFLGRLRDYNTYYEERSALQFKWKQDKSGNLLVDGMLNIYWGLKRSIRLQMADGGVKIRPQSQLEDIQAEAVRKFEVLTTGEPIKEENVNIVMKNEKLSGTIMRKKLSRPRTIGETPTNGGQKVHVNTEDSDGLLRQKSVILRKRLSSKSGKKRFSINGHAYNHQTSVFTPDYASVTNVRITSKTCCDDVIKHLLNKFRVENSSEEFSLYLVKETGERRELTRSEFPLITRVLSGPNEQFCKIFIMDRNMHRDISSEVAQYIKLDLNILSMVVKKFNEEEERETERMKERYEMYRKMLKKRIEELASET
uniref:uncharacterized protein LOC120347794 isoform X2 n=1 Tax=Styela clava TaxID=7725 RepID=UPI00193AB609|nr:uncharacterized protein LOC120347794 isoform X2 [Styela clava]